IQDAQEVLAFTEHDLRSAIDSPAFLFFMLYKVRTSHVWMLPIPTGPVPEWNELFAGLLLKAHKNGAAFWSWMRLNWIMFWACGRVKIRATTLCPKCYARNISGFGPIVARGRRSLHVGIQGASRGTRALRATVRPRPRPVGSLPRPHHQRAGARGPAR